MVSAPLNDNKFKWVSSSLNIALNTNKAKSDLDKNSVCNILTQDEKYKWVSSRLNVSLNIENNRIHSFAKTSQNEKQSKLSTKTKIQISTRLEVLQSNESNRSSTEKGNNTNLDSSQETANMPTKVPVEAVDITPEHFQCNQCPFIAKKNSTLSRHGREVHKSYCKNCLKIILGYHKHCKRCSFIGEQPGLVKDHIKKAHKQKVVLVECQVCKKVLKGKSLLNHTNSHHLGIKYDCGKCSKSFTARYYLKKHQSLNPHDNLDSECNECGKIFQSSKHLHSKNKLILHKKRKHLEPTNKCNLCSEVFIFRKGLQKHTIKHKTNHETYFCSSCDDKFIMKESLLKHNIRVHKYEPVMYIGKRCSICGIQVRPKLFKEHRLSHMESCKKCDFRGVHIWKHMVTHDGVKCNSCNKTMSTMSSLVVHQKDVHGIFDKNRHIHMCNSCSSGFKSLKVLKRHKQKIHERILQCEKCEFQAATKSKLIHHRKTHERKWFSCILCDFKSTLEISLNVHHKRVHKGYTCDICKNKFTNLTSLRKHQSKNHEQINCDNCEFIASSRTSILVHNKHSHSNLRCDTCNKIFMQQKALDHHKLKHAELTCKFCGVYCKKKKDLEKHTDSHHVIRKCEKCDFEGANKQINAHQKTSHKITSINKNIETEKSFRDLPGVVKTEKVQKENILDIKTLNVEEEKLQLSNINTHIANDYSQKIECNRCLKTHLLQEFKDHRKTCLYSCPQCPFNTKNMFRLNNHLGTHKEASLTQNNHQVKNQQGEETTNDFECELCQFKTSTIVALSKHLDIHKVPEETLLDYECDICPFKTSSGDTLDVHVKDHRYVQENTDTTVFLNTQSDIHQMPEDKLHKVHKNPTKLLTNFECNICEFQAITNETLNKHIEIHREAEDKLIELRCEIRPFQTTSGVVLIDPLDIHKEPEASLIKYECVQCSYKTTKPGALSQHVIFHDWND